jgi:hypothetical protein
VKFLDQYGVTYKGMAPWMSINIDCIESEAGDALPITD